MAETRMHFGFECMSHTRLPLEIWSEIYKLLPFSQHRALLFVSRLFHDLSVQFLFSTVNIFFFRDLADPRYQLQRAYRSVDHILEPQMRRSWEILDHIRHDPSFARLVRTLRIHSETSLLLFETFSIASALQALPNLHSFHWFYTEIPDEVALSLPDNLRCLHIALPPTSGALYHLKSLQEARFFQLTPYYQADTIYPSLPSEGTNHDVLNTCDVIDANKSLQKLMVAESHIGKIPLRTFQRLTALEIYVSWPTQFSGLDIIFLHCPNITSLALRGYVQHEEMLILQSNKHALPNLEIFRLEIDHPGDDLPLPMITIVAEFIMKHKALRRLFLSMDCVLVDFMHVVLAIAQLTDIKVLGLEIRDYGGSQELMALAPYLPQSLVALHLGFWFVDDGIVVSVFEPLITSLQQIPGLSFLSLVSVDTVPCDHMDLARNITQLDTIVLNRTVFEVLRTETEVETLAWSLLQVESCTEECFRSSGDYWLFVHRGRRGFFYRL